MMPAKMPNGNSCLFHRRGAYTRNCIHAKNPHWYCVGAKRCKHYATNPMLKERTK